MGESTRSAADDQLSPLPNSGLRIDAVVGGQYGSEGKGRICANLAAEYDVLMRVGGPNAGHTVRLDHGATYVSRHLPSGAAVTDALLLIGPGAVMDPDILEREITAHELTPDRLVIDPSAILVEPSDKSADAARYARIGTTGSGISTATMRRISARDGQTELRRAGSDPRLAPFVSETTPFLYGLVAERTSLRILLEGTQGAGLSLLHGDYPYVTARDTTVMTLLAEAGLPWTALRRVLLVCRRFPIRAGGSSGPLPEETTWRDVEERAGLPPGQLSDHEVGSVSGRPRRVGAFNPASVIKAIMLNGATDIALTCMDHEAAPNRTATTFEALTPESREFVDALERAAGIPVSLLTTGPAHGDLIDRRVWP